jgi:hypothetical protein
VERDLFEKTAQAVNRALLAKNGTEVRRQLQAARRLGLTAYFRHPDSWSNELDHLAGRLTEFPEPLKARPILEEGRRAASRNDRPGVEKAVRELWKMLPPDPEDRRLGHNSGVR